MGLSNVAVQYLQYPTHILFKSAKPIPTLLAGPLASCVAATRGAPRHRPTVGAADRARGAPPPLGEASKTGESSGGQAGEGAGR